MVTDAKSVGGANHHIGLVAPGFNAAIPALFVENQADAAPLAGWASQSGHNRFGASHLGHAPWVYKGHRFNAAGARLFQHPDKGDAVLDAQHRLFILQAVTGADLDNLYLASVHGAAPAADVLGGSALQSVRVTGLPLE